MTSTIFALRPRRVRQLCGVCLSLAGGLCFLLLATPRLTAQGLYYDELHQACAAFAFKGIQPKFFTPLDLWGIPLMNMAYSGALKSDIYGLYLRFADASFEVHTFRLLGIGLGCVGLIFFSLRLHSRMRIAGLFLFLVLFETDQTILLTVRHDWGPVALSLTLRLVLLAVWLRAEFRKEISPANTFILGLLLSLLIFEKLSAIVLVPPLILMLLLNPLRRTTSHSVAFMAGGFVGGLPLIAANLIGYARYGLLLSFMKVGEPGFNWDRLPTHVENYLALGSGKFVKPFAFARLPATRIWRPARSWCCCWLSLVSVWPSPPFRLARVRRFARP